jgi:hypothetical protein
VGGRPTSRRARHRLTSGYRALRPDTGFVVFLTAVRVGERPAPLIAGETRGFLVTRMSRWSAGVGASIGTWTSAEVMHQLLPDRAMRRAAGSTL